MPPDTTATPSGRRREPSQDRSRDTVDAIYAAAAAIIHEQGIGALTTNLVARRAGVSITSVYGYFTDKWAIVEGLFERFELQRADLLVDILADFATVDDWRPVIDDTWARMAALRIEVPGAVALRRALHSHPRLAQLDTENSEASATNFARALIARRPDLAWDDAYRTAWAVSLIAGVLIDDAVRDGEIAWDRLREGTAVVKRHLGPLLDDAR